MYKAHKTVITEIKCGSTACPTGCPIKRFLSLHLFLIWAYQICNNENTNKLTITFLNNNEKNNL